MRIFRDEEFDFLDKKTRKILMESREAFVPHTPYQYEKNMLNAVKCGNMEEAKYWTSQIDAGKAGTLSSNVFRQEQIMFMVYVSLITRASLEGGVKEDLAYAMSDSYIQTVGNCTTILQISKLKERALKDFVNAVKNQRKSVPYSKVVRKAIRYMQNHFKENISVEELAGAVGVSQSRLSHLFKEETGVSLMTYLRKEKIENAKAMLRDSDYRIYEISTILGFANESYFVKVFKDYEGITPGEYKRKGAAFATP